MNCLDLTARLNTLVFGLTVEWRANGGEKLFPGTYDPPPFLLESERAAWPRVFRPLALLPYDHAAAFELVDGMARKGFTFSLIREPDTDLWLGGFGINGDGINYAQGETPAMAICLGVLRALGGGR